MDSLDAFQSIHPTNLFEDAGTTEEIYAETYRVLDMIVNNMAQSCTAVGDDVRVDLGLFLPQPFLLCLRSIGRLTQNVNEFTYYLGNHGGAFSRLRCQNTTTKQQVSLQCLLYSPNLTRPQRGLER